MERKEIGLLRSELKKIPGALKKATDSKFGPIVTSLTEHNISFNRSGKPRPEEKFEDKPRQNSINQVDIEVSQSGVEALAWYSSFHRETQSKHPAEWGIFIKESSLYYLSDRLFEDVIGESQNLTNSFKLLLAHELFHYWTDLEIARLELITTRPLWRFDRWARDENHRIRSMFGPSTPRYWDLEEQLANSSMIRQIQEHEIPVSEDALRNFVKNQPQGYRDGFESIEDFTFQTSCRELIRLKLGAMSWIRNSSLFSQSFAAFSPMWFDGYTGYPGPPIFLVRDAHKVFRRAIELSEGLIQKIEIAEESRRFQKQLGRLHPDHQKQWVKKKSELAHRVPGHPEFEKLAGISDVYSIRINRGYRAHLRFSRQDGVWIAEEIGSHSMMGHD
jgi:plasmid maintenance system killer protein